MRGTKRLVALLAASSLVVSATTTAWGAKAPRAPKTGTVVVRDSLVPASDPGRFDFSIDGLPTFTNGGSGYADGGTTGPQTVAAGRGVAVSERAHTGTNSTSYTSRYVCTKNGAAYISGAGTRVRRGVNVGAGDVVVCTFTNTNKRPLQVGSLQIAKTLGNPDGATGLPSAYTAHYDCGTGHAGSVVIQPGAPATVSNIPGGAVCTVSEDALAPIAGYTWAAPTYTPSSVAISAGTTSVIVVANALVKTASRQGTIELKKVWSGGASTTTLAIGNTVGGSNIAGKAVSGDDTTGPFTVPVGTYYVSESAVANYSGSLACMNGPTAVSVGPNNSVSVGNGDAVVCTFTNTYVPPAADLAIVVAVTNDNGGTAVASGWVVSATGPTTLTGAGGASREVPAGTYTLAEVGPHGYSAAGWSCVGGVVSGSSVVVDPGTSVRCTITNDDLAPRLHLRAVVVNDNNGTAVATAWTLSATAADSAATSLVGVTPVDSDSQFSAGTYTLAESGPTGYSETWSCLDAGGGAVPLAGSDVTLGLADDVTCTASNDDIARTTGTIELKKVWSGGASTTTLAIGAFQGGTDVATKTVTTDDTTGPQTVQSGTYWVSETMLADYTAALDCTNGTTRVSVGTFGNVTVAAGDAVVCTLTNTLVPNAPRPVANDCAAGYVAFTFDDGPSENSEPLLAVLRALNLKATFFVIGENLSQTFGDGQKAISGARIVADEVAAGNTIGDHTWDHASFTGQSAGAAPLTDSQVTNELVQAAQAIRAAGAPYPTLYRPPYGDINNYYELLARNLGFRVVMSYGTASDSAGGDGNIVDSGDYDSSMTAQSIADRVINGYTRTVNGATYHWHGIQAATIVAMHDGSGPEAQNTIDSLQAIVDAMNAKHLCSTATVRSDATGNIVSPPPPNPPGVGNLVHNPSLEQLTGNPPQSAAEPVCWQHAGYGNNAAAWTLTGDAHDGVIAERLDESNWVNGDGKLVMTQRSSQSTCLPAVTPSKTYEMWVWYKGNWVFQGTGAAAVSIATFYRDTAGGWHYWQGSPWFPPTSSWNLAYFKSGPLPLGATAVSWGLALQGNGTLTTDDYTMVEDP